MDKTSLGEVIRFHNEYRTWDVFVMSIVGFNYGWSVTILSKDKDIKISDFSHA